jgi:hypothetical protein
MIYLLGSEFVRRPTGIGKCLVCSEGNGIGSRKIGSDGFFSKEDL